MSKNTLYLLQVQRIEGCVFENLYYDTQKALATAVDEGKKNLKIRYFSGASDIPAIIPVFRMRTFRIMRSNIKP